MIRVPKPSLEYADARVERAKQHLIHLKRRHAIFWNRPIKEILPDPRIPPLFSILVGEIIYNQRAALDYLVFELAILDSRRIQKYTQFPIEDWPEEAAAQNKLKKCWAPEGKHPMLRGISVSHKAILRQFQPFEGCNWTRELRELSNPDKHRRTWEVFWQIDFSPDRPHRKAKRSRSKPSMNMQDMFAGQILFEDRSPVIETLQVFQREVPAVLDMFRREF